MQDIHSIGPGGGGLFSGGGGGGGGDRRLRSIAGAALSLHLTGGHHHGGGPQAALKCPRCDSLNTKFCYYNNYNLSQPRHFCKSCRRYWTKGGVLRNVPVGGGCRKSKRSSKPSSVKRSSSHSPPPPPAADPPVPAPASNSHSSSESSSLTATNAVTAEAVSGFSSLVFEGGPPMFPDLGGLSGLMTSASSEGALTSFGFNSNSLLLGHGQQQLHEQEQVWDQQVRAGVMDHDDDHHHHHHKVSVDGGGGGVGGGFGPLDWQGTGGVSVDQGLFDLPVINTVDQAYWSQSQWSTGDHDHPNLFLP